MSESGINLTSYVTLKAGASLVEIKTMFENTAKDHRLRAIFGKNVNGEHVEAYGQFDRVVRPLVPLKEWLNPNNTQRMDGYVSIYDGARGLAVASRGLPEYEGLADGKIALTLVRSVGEMGDWNYFPTPGGQCIRTVIAEYAVGVFTGKDAENQKNACAKFVAGNVAYVQADCEVMKGEKSEIQLLDIKCSKNIYFSALKKCENDESVILRVYNPDTNPGSIYCACDFSRVDFEECIISKSINKDNINAKKISSYKIKN